nr:unnamed protein product [Digitaria exilis]
MRGRRQTILQPRLSWMLPQANAPSFMLPPNVGSLAGGLRCPAARGHGGARPLPLSSCPITIPELRHLTWTPPAAPARDSLRITRNQHATSRYLDPETPLRDNIPREESPTKHALPLAHPMLAARREIAGITGICCRRSSLTLAVFDPTHEAPSYRARTPHRAPRRRPPPGPPTRLRR